MVQLTENWNLRKKLGRLQAYNWVQNQAEIKATKARLDEILHREEIMWMQRSRIYWLREGNQNTKYFHRKASWSVKNNRISKLKRSDGSFAHDSADMTSMTASFFT